MVEREKVTILATLTDRFSGPLAKLRVGLTGVLNTIRTLGRVGAAPFTLLSRGLGGLVRSLTSIQGLLAGGAAAGILRVFGQFESNMAQVATLVDTSVVNVDRLGEGLQQIAVKTGDGLDSLTKGLFDAISAGADTANVLTFLDTASRLAAGGSTTTAVAIDGLTTILNSYGLETEKVVEVSDSLFAAMKGGKTTIEELAQSIGLAAPIAKTVGLSVDELTGSIAALTKGGLSTQIAVTSLRSLLTGILKPTAEAAEAAEEYGIELSSTALRAKGLTEFLAEISRRIDDNDEAYGRLFPNVRAFTAATAIGSGNAKVLAEQMELMADKVGATDEAFGKVADTFFFKLRQIRNLLYKFFIQVGEAAKPFLDDLIGDESKGTGLQGFLARLGNSGNQIRAAITGIVGTFARLREAITEIFSSGDVTTVLVNSVAAGLEAIVRLWIAYLPLLLRTVQFVGAELAKALVRSFIAESSRELAVTLAQGSGVSGFFKDLAARAGLGNEAVEELTRQGEALIDAQKNLASDLQQLNEKLGISQDRLVTVVDEEGNKLEEIRTDTVEGLRDVFNRLQSGDLIKGADLSQVRGSFATELFEGVLNRAEEEKRRLEEALQTLTDSPDAFRESFRRESAALTAEADVFIGTVGDILSGAIDRVQKGLQEPTKESIRDLVNFITEELPRQFAEAAVADKAAAEAKKVVEDAADKTKQALAPLALDLGEESGIPGGVNDKQPQEVLTFENLKEGARQFFTVFDQGATVGAALASQLASGIGGIVDTFFDANASWSDFAANFLKTIAKMLIQIALFRALSSALGTDQAGGGGGGTPAARMGGWLGNDGRIHRFREGTDFVPGPRSERRDTVRALLAPGEAVIRRDSTDYYGRELFARLNRRLIPKSSISALLSGAAANTSAVVKRGFNSGGFAASSSRKSGQQTVVQPVLLVDDRTMEDMLSKGHSGLVRHMTDHADEINGALGQTNKGFT